MIDVTDRDALRGWFEQQNHDVVSIIVARCALRVFPRMNELLDSRKTDQPLSFMIEKVLRAITTAQSAGTWLNRANDLQALEAADALALVARNMSVATQDTIFSAIYAADVAANAEHPIKAINAAYNAVTNSNTIYPDIDTITIKTDIGFIERGGTAQDLTQQPIWNVLVEDFDNADFDNEFNMPNELYDDWLNLKAYLFGFDEDWDVWTDWYEDRLRGGVPLIETLEIGDPKNYDYGRATFPENWYEDPAKLNAALKEKIEAYWKLQRLKDYRPQTGFEYQRSGSELIIQHRPNDSDIAIAQDQNVAMLFTEIQRKSQSLQTSCQGLGENHNWDDLESSVNRYAKFIANDISDVTAKILLMHSRTIELASYLDEDADLQKQPEGNKTALPAKVRRELKSLIVSVGPWVRKFPSARAEDDELGSFLANPTLYQPSKIIMAQVAQVSLLSDDDRTLLNGLLDAIKRESAMSKKAGAKGQKSLRNLLITCGSILGGVYLGAASSLVTEDSIIANKIAEVFLSSESAIIAVIKEAPSDIQIAIKTVIEHAKDDQKSPTPKLERRTELIREDEENEES